MIPSAAPLAWRGTRSTAIKPPTKQIRTPMAMPNRIMARMFMNMPEPEYRNRPSDTEQSMPNTTAIL